jgi:hypothetical protein
MYASLGSTAGRAALQTALTRALDGYVARLPEGWSLARATIEREFSLSPAGGAKAVATTPTVVPVGHRVDMSNVGSSVGGASNEPTPTSTASTAGTAGTAGTASTSLSLLDAPIPSPSTAPPSPLCARLEAAASGMVDLLSTLSLQAPDPRVRQATLGIFARAVYSVGHPVLGDVFSSASLRLSARLLTREGERDAEVERLQRDCRARDAACAELAREAERRAGETAAALEKVRDAERELDSLENSLACPICLDSFVPRDPAALACGHIFCRECIDLVINQTGSRIRRPPVCPQCRAPVTDAPRMLKGLG